MLWSKDIASNVNTWLLELEKCNNSRLVSCNDINCAREKNDEQITACILVLSFCHLSFYLTHMRADLIRGQQHKWEQSDMVLQQQGAIAFGQNLEENSWYPQALRLLPVWERWVQIKTGQPVMRTEDSVVLQLDNDDGLQGWNY